MIDRVSDIIPKSMVGPLTELGKTDWAVLEMTGPETSAIHVKDYPDFIEPMMKTPHDKLAVFSIAKWLAPGPKTLRLTDLQCQALAETELRLPPEDYRQPFPALLVDFGKGFVERHEVGPRCVLCYHQPPFLCFLVFSRDNKHDVISGLRLDLVKDLEETISKYHDTVTPEEAEASTEALRVAINANLLLVNYGHTVSPLLPVERASNERLARRGNEKARERLSYDLFRVDFEQNTVVYDVQEPSPVGIGTHASPRPHWRRGHWRRQHHGKGGELVKNVFIRPVLVKGIGKVIPATYVRR